MGILLYPAETAGLAAVAVGGIIDKAPEAVFVGKVQVEFSCPIEAARQYGGFAAPYRGHIGAVTAADRVEGGEGGLPFVGDNLAGCGRHRIVGSDSFTHNAPIDLAMDRVAYIKAFGFMLSPAAVGKGAGHHRHGF